MRPGARVRRELGETALALDRARFSFFRAVICCTNDPQSGDLRSKAMCKF